MIISNCIDLYKLRVFGCQEYEGVRVLEYEGDIGQRFAPKMPFSPVETVKQENSHTLIPPYSHTLTPSHAAQRLEMRQVVS